MIKAVLKAYRTLSPIEMGTLSSMLSFVQGGYSERTYPDISEAYGIVMCREAERQFFGDGLFISS